MFFERPGTENTQKTLEIAVEAARAEGIDTLVVASCSGQVVEALLKLPVAGLRIVCVTHVNGFRENGVQDLSPEKRRELEGKGVICYTGTHVLSGAERGLSRRFQGVYPVELIAATLRMLGQGTKVCVECAVMALDGGLLEYQRPVVAVGGTGSGADTALVLRPAHAAGILDTKIDKVLCKPVL